MSASHAINLMLVLFWSESGIWVDLCLCDQYTYLTMSLCLVCVCVLTLRLCLCLCLSTCSWVNTD
jgi:hypothetical protein